MIVEFLLSIMFLYVIIILYCHFKYPEVHWDWTGISLKKMSFPSTFIWGTATAAHQVEGNCLNNWSAFEKGSKDNGEPNIKDGQQSGIACDHWNKYPEDIKLIKE